MTGPFVGVSKSSTIGLQAKPLPLNERSTGKISRSVTHASLNSIQSKDACLGPAVFTCALQRGVPAKFGEGSSVMAVGLCIGCPMLVGRRKAGNSNMQEFFCTTLY